MVKSSHTIGTRGWQMPPFFGVCLFVYPPSGLTRLFSFFSCIVLLSHPSSLFLLFFSVVFPLRLFLARKKKFLFRGKFFLFLSPLILLLLFRWSNFKCDGWTKGVSLSVLPSSKSCFCCFMMGREENELRATSVYPV